MATSVVKISLIVTTYNWPAALELVLKSVAMQRILPDEVIIADDGSTSETTALIQRYQESFPTVLRHCWQEDDGFRLAQIRNKAIAMATENYIVMVDGDMVLHPLFIQDHLHIAQKKQFIQGRRVILTEDEAQRALANQRTTFNLWSNGVKNKFNALHCSLLSPFISSLFSKHNHQSVRGCNMAFWRADVVKINGFNEAFVGWGREDSEFVVRLLNSGVKRKDLRLGGIAYHLYHPENTKKQLIQNDQILQNTINNRIKYCEKGINQYL